ncbi:MAG: hypothetical protein K2Y23_11490 [Cyanobacteria bacterium]|nr:hypothetical protein [Cyanobacteriota bacterium]
MSARYSPGAQAPRFRPVFAQWKARDLQELLGYDKWQNFSTAIERAQASCASSNEDVSHHFAETSKLVNIGSGARRETEDWFLSRYACYLIAVNGDPDKPEIGYAQSYFLVQARKQEKQDQLTEIERRALLRERVRDSNKKLGVTMWISGRPENKRAAT